MFASFTVELGCCCGGASAGGGGEAVAEEAAANWPTFALRTGLGADGVTRRDGHRTALVFP